MKKTLALVLVLSIALSMVFAQGGVESSTAAKKYVLTIGHGSAVDSLEDKAVNVIATEAAKLSNGRLEVQVFPAEQLGNFSSMMESTSNGSQDIVWGDLTWLGNVVKDYQILSMGYAFRDQDHINAFMDSEIGQGLKQQLLDKTNILLLTSHANSLPRVTVSKFPIKTPADLKGVKMRVPGIPIFVEVWTAMETKPTSVSWGEVYLALQQGVVDAMECGYEFIYPQKFYEVASYVTLTNHVRGLRGMLINNDSYTKLPSDLQAILTAAGEAGEKYYNAELAKLEKGDTEKLLAQGTIINTVDIPSFQAKMGPLVQKLESEGFWSAGLFEKVQAIK
jgi:tripartite ATP-independent transporter DctP family solute receptor